MGEKIQFKGAMSHLALSFNRKEETLLKRKLSILESMKRQAANSRMLDQKILYNRFTAKLRRSELAHAKLHGNQDLVSQLTRRAFSTFHTTVTDHSENAVRAILQQGQRTRVTSAPCKLQSQGAPISSAGQKSGGDDQDEEGENKDVSVRWPRVSENEIKLGVGGLRKNCAKECNPGTKSFPASRQWWGTDKRVHFDHPRPHTTKDEKSDRKQFTGDYAPGVASVLLTTQPQDPEAANAELSAPVSPEGRAEGRRLKGEFPRHPYNSDGSSRGNHALRPSSWNPPLGLRETPVEMPSFVKAQVMASVEADFNDKVKLFVQKVKALRQQQGSLLKDYYSERLMDKLERKHHANQGLLLDTQQEQRKWALVGAEPCHRSITVKKLDRNCIRKDVPTELLIWEYYNEILTKENQFERNWPNNNPDHMITGLIL